MTTEECSRLITFFGEYAEYYDKVYSFEKEKLAFVGSDHIAELESSLRQEQALAMQGTVFERKREALLEELSLSGKSFSDIVELAPSPQKSELKAVREAFADAVFRSKRIAEEMEAVMRDRLRALQQSSPAIPSAQAAEIYTGRGQKRQQTEASTIIGDV